MALRRGFKREANSIAAEIRSELGLSDIDRLDPVRLAAHLGVPIFSVSELATTSGSSVILHFINIEPNAFSAATIFRGPARVIIHNDAHAEGRRNSNLAHELSHALLHHPKTPAIDQRGCRIWSQDIEDEATWLAGALLIPEGAALAIAHAFRWKTYEEAARHFQVSESMVNYRVGITGARMRVARTRIARRK